MLPWIVDALAGLLLAVLLYGLVRLRMLVAPRMLARFGSWARWMVWVVVGLLMIAVANLELLGLRDVLRRLLGHESLLLHEILFAVVALMAGYYLVAKYVTSKPRDKNSGKGC